MLKYKKITLGAFSGKKILMEVDMVEADLILMISTDYLTAIFFLFINMKFTSIKVYLV